MKILFEGDSITDAGRIRDNHDTRRYGQGYCLLAAAELEAEAPGKYDIQNQAIAGSRVVDVYARIKSADWTLKPDVYSLLIGVNDVWHRVWNNDVEAPRFERVYRMLIEDTRAALPGVKMMLLEPFTLKGSATEEHWEWFRPEVEKRAEIVARLAKEYGVSFVPLQKLLDDACRRGPADNWLYDGVHPTPAGYRLIADAWMKVFRKEIDI